MKSNHHGAAWPYLFILAGLFALSINAPRAWQHFQSAGRSMIDLLEERSVIKPAPDKTTVDEAPRPKSNWVLSSRSIAPMVVKPLREFGRQVIDPIIEIAKRPTELRALPDLFFPRVEPHDIQVPTDPEEVWALPDTLLDTLDRLSTHPEVANWSEHVSELIRELLQNGRKNARPAMEILVELNEAADPAELPIAHQAEVTTDLQRARWALVRRVEIWQPIARLRDSQANLAMSSAAADESGRTSRLSKCLDDVEQLTATTSTADAWRDYLSVEQIRSLAQSSDSQSDARRIVARKVLERLETSRLSAAQRKFVTNTPIASLSNELRPWAADEVSLPQMMRHLEQFERSQSAKSAALVAVDSRSLRWNSDDAMQQLGEQVDLHYRNANLRMSLTTEFVNRLVPQPRATQSWVRDTIQGIPVHGSSTTFTKVTVRTIPDQRRVRMGLEASGMVASNTTAEAGPATFYNNGESSFMVRKLVLFGPSGLRIWPAIAEADSYYNDLRDVETNFDGVPLIGSLVRNIARSHHDEAQGEARHEVESKVAARARAQFDQEVQPRLDKMSADLEARLLEPMRRMNLEPTALDMSTSEDRITMRMRLAGNDQLAAYTPRPRAPSDSLVSIQLHQSALNNMFDKLDLAGREFTTLDLYAWIGKKLNRPDLKQPEDMPEGVMVKFADSEPLRVRCNDGRMALTISIAKLTYNNRRWRDFLVKTTYVPDMSFRAARFTRASAIFLEGKSLQGRPEFVLRSIVSKALSADRPWQLVPERFATDPRLADVDISQFIVDDGWIGLAYAARRVPSDVVRKPK